MARTSIQQFRAALVDRANQTALMRGYRQLARNSASDATRVGGDWLVWTAASTAPGEWQPWGAAPAATPAASAA